MENVLSRIRTERIYKLLRLCGVCLAFGAIGTELLDRSVAAIGLLALGVAIYVMGTVGAWWNEA